MDSFKKQPRQQQQQQQLKDQQLKLFIDFGGSVFLLSNLNILKPRFFLCLSGFRTSTHLQLY
jgi:hypothetical protein